MAYGDTTLSCKCSLVRLTLGEKREGRDKFENGLSNTLARYYIPERGWIPRFPSALIPPRGPIGAPFQNVSPGYYV